MTFQAASTGLLALTAAARARVMAGKVKCMVVVVGVGWLVGWLFVVLVLGGMGRW